MPHQCVRCGKLYEDASEEILKGCSCGAKMFYFIRKEKLKQIQEQQEKEKLTLQEKEEIEKEVYDLIGDNIDMDKPVILDIESIEILKPGKYQLDLVKLFKAKEPLIYKLEDGKYMVDIVESFKKMGRKAK
ncbi:MAG: Zn-ribbon domain-containing protein [Nanoarchaeota archaeon]|nr:Zn-ribbon domain-containing protein [Nanoarchaeota archaeon]MBU1321599.1 Zn-ribbon domain-containing protein [Nanoarchaeota archaeon]MBU1598007.1 Zn-ribbon domain-containing protein [Nanoarchaeota archaeon]MBU2440957.1 Zn-ribbon domain-containing protein [Nanoarchaeota archaeon]